MKDKMDAIDNAIENEYKISVIIPVFNVERYLRTCLNSILDQTYKPFEVILIDDGSTDDSLKICNEYAATHEWIHVIHKENEGISKTRNLGMSIAKGNYFSFIDPDDWLHEDMYRRLVDALRNTGADLAVCDVVKVINNKDGTTTYQEGSMWQFDGVKTFFGHEIYTQVYDKTATMWNKLIPVKNIGKTCFNTEIRYGEDQLFIAELFKNIKSVCVIPEAFYYYQINRKGNVVSSPIDDRSIDYMESAYLVYRILSGRGEAICGVRRCMMAIPRMLTCDSPKKESERYYQSAISYIRKIDKGDVIHAVMNKQLPKSAVLVFFTPRIYRTLYRLIYGGRQKSWL